MMENNLPTIESDPPEINNETCVRDIESDAPLIITHEPIVIKGTPSKFEKWYQWLKYRIDHYMIVETVFFIGLIFLLTSVYQIFSQNQKTIEMISTLQSQIANLEKRFDSSTDSNLDLNQTQSTLKENKFTTKLPQLAKRINSEPTPSVSSNSQDPSIICSLTSFNAANILIGASVDSEYSSRAVPKGNEDIGAFFLKGDQSGYVLLDREEISSNKPWCSNDKQPILTVNLAKHIKPTAVSYQHTKWNKTIPDQAPKSYDLVACLDSKCENVEQLVSSCEYKSENKIEQFCMIPSMHNLPPINKVQFHFHENHGDTEKTCAYLVRVYGERADPPVEEKANIFPMLMTGLTCACFMAVFWCIKKYCCGK